MPFGKGPVAKYRMRPICPACNQRPCAVNYIKDGVKHYRTRCDNCLRKGRGIKKRIPRWEAAGYKKKIACDKCGFKARYSAQTLVYHVDGDLNNIALKNLKTVCRNCEVDLAKTDSVWRPGDLQPDV